MVRKLTTCIPLLIFLLLSASLIQAADLTLESAPTTICFSPNGNCTSEIINALLAAKREVLVQAYSFTSAPIAKALLGAHKRGVKVQVILDKSQRTAKYSSADFLTNNGVRTLIDAAHAIAHNKIMIIDYELVITGSFNFTKAAEERNAENLLIIHSKNLASIYIENWNNHAVHCFDYVRNK